MRVTIKENTDNMTVYPCLKKLDECVVLFIKPETGVCLRSGHSTRPVGYYQEEWAEDNFKVMSQSESVILSNGEEQC